MISPSRVASVSKVLVALLIAWFLIYTILTSYEWEFRKEDFDMKSIQTSIQDKLVALTFNERQEYDLDYDDYRRFDPQTDELEDGITPTARKFMEVCN